MKKEKIMEGYDLLQRIKDVEESIDDLESSFKCHIDDMDETFTVYGHLNTSVVIGSKKLGINLTEYVIDLYKEKLETELKTLQEELEKL